jgi:hypothetical protein
MVDIDSPSFGFEGLSTTGTHSASRLPRAAVRELSATTDECRVNLDYVDQQATATTAEGRVKTA